jgi:hypothetical protein
MGDVLGDRLGSVVGLKEGDPLGDIVNTCSFSVGREKTSNSLAGILKLASVPSNKSSSSGIENS